MQTMKLIKNWEWKDNILFKLVCRQLLLFLIPVILLFLLALAGIQRQHRLDESQLLRQLKDKVDIVQTSMDEYIKQCQIMNYVLMQDEAVYYLINSDYSDSVDYSVRIHQVAAELNSLCLMNSFVDDIVICINQNRINVNAEGALSADEVYEKYIRQDGNGYTYQQWLSESLKFKNGHMLVMPDGTCYFIKTYPVAPRGSINKSMTLIKFKDDIMVNYLTDSSDDTSFTMLSSGNTIDLFGILKPLNIDISKLRLDAPGNSFFQDGYYISYQKSQNLDMTYLAAVSQEQLLTQKNQEIIWTMFLLSACLLLGSTFVILYTVHKLNPINQLRSTVRTDGNHGALFLDPYAETKSILLETADQQLTHSNKVNQPKNEQLQHTFIALLYEKKQNAVLLAQNANQLDIPYETKQSCFIKLKCIDISNCFQKIGKQDDVDCTPFQFCATLIAEMMSEEYEILAIPHGQEVFFVLSVDDQKLEVSLKDMKHQLQQIQRLLQESYEIDTLIALSNFHSGIKGLHAAFREANKIMEYLEFSASSNFAEYGYVSIINKHRGVGDSFIKEETKLLNAIKAGESDWAREIFDRILDNFFPDTHDKSPMAKFHIYALAGKMLEAFDAISRMQSENWLENLDDSEHLMNFTTIVEFRENMHKLFDHMKDSSAALESTDKHSIVANIMDIIASNYMNPDLNVSMIASLLDKNLDYVSRTFKKNTGLGILECIQDYRIGKAKTYLEENSSLTIQQVSSMVGYINCESFIRIFKQKQGVTPGRYKTMLKKKD